MIWRIVCTALCCLGFSVAGAQQLKPTVYYMGLPNVSKAAKDYHSGAVPAGDDEATYSIADSMGTFNTDTRPFYIFLVSKILMTANRKLSTEMGRECRSFLQEEPDAVIDLLFSPSVKPVYKYQWARAIALDMATSCPGIVGQCFKNSRATALRHCREANKEHLELIYNEIRNNLHIHH